MNYTQDYVIETLEVLAEKMGSYSKLAEWAGICKSTLSNWKNGKQLPSPETFFKYFPFCQEEETPEEPEEPKQTSRRKQPTPETVHIQNHADEMMNILCAEILGTLRGIYKRSYIKVATIDYNSVLTISLIRSFGSYTSKLYFTKVYINPVDHAYLDPDWAKVVISDFTKSVDTWILRQFKS